MPALDHKVCVSLINVYLKVPNLVEFDLTSKMSIIKMIQNNKKILIIGASSILVLIIIIVVMIPHGVARCPDGATGNKIRNNI